MAAKGGLTPARIDLTGPVVFLPEGKGGILRGLFSGKEPPQTPPKAQGRGNFDFPPPLTRPLENDQRRGPAVLGFAFGQIGGRVPLARTDPSLWNLPRAVLSVGLWPARRTP